MQSAAATSPSRPTSRLRRRPRSSTATATRVRSALGRSPDRPDYLLFFVSDEGLDAIIGQKFFERYYVTLDTDRSRVGIAKTQYSSQGNSF